MASKLCYYLYAGPFLRPEPTQNMVERSALLARMTDGEKSVRNFVNNTNLWLARLLFPHQSLREEGVNQDELFPDPLVEMVVEDVTR